MSSFVPVTTPRRSRWDSTSNGSSLSPTDSQTYLGSDSSSLESIEAGARRISFTQSREQDSSEDPSPRKRKRSAYATYKPASYHAKTMLTDGEFDIFETLFLQSLPDKLMDIIQGTEVRPERIPGESEDDFEDALERFDERNAKLFLCLSDSLQLNGKQQLISSCKLSDGLAAWKYLASVSTSCDTVTRALVIRNIKEFKQSETDMDDMAHRVALEAMFKEAGRIGLFNQQAIDVVLPLVYAESLPESLSKVKELILLSGQTTKLTVGYIYQTITAHRRFAQQQGTSAFAAKAVEKTRRKPFKNSRHPRYPPSTEEEKAGTCSLCGFKGHAARTCRKNPEFKLKESAHLAVEEKDDDFSDHSYGGFTEEAIALVAIVADVPSAQQRGKGFSSNSLGDGPTEAEQLEIERAWGIRQRLAQAIVGQAKTFLRSPHLDGDIHGNRLSTLIEELRMAHFEDPAQEAFLFLQLLKKLRYPEAFLDSLPDALESTRFDGTLQSLWSQFLESSSSAEVVHHEAIEDKDTIGDFIRSLDGNLGRPAGRVWTPRDMVLLEASPTQPVARKAKLGKLTDALAATAGAVADVVTLAKQVMPGFEYSFRAREEYQGEIRAIDLTMTMLTTMRERLMVELNGIPTLIHGKPRQVVLRSSVATDAKPFMYDRDKCADTVKPIQRKRPRSEMEDGVQPETTSSSSSSSSASYAREQQALPVPEVFPPPPTAGAEFSSDPIADGPTSMSLPLRKARLGRRPKLVKFYKFLVDSGCSRHMVNSSEVPLLDASETRTRISGIDKEHPMTATKVGKFGILQNVLGVTDLSHNLVSVGAACMNGYKFVFSKNGVTMFEESDVLFNFPLLNGKLINNLFYFDLTCDVQLRDDLTLHPIAMPATIIPENRAALWHARLGHISTRTIKHLIKQEMTQNFSQSPTEQMWTDYSTVRCEACVRGKMTLSHVRRVPTSTESHRVTDKRQDNPYEKGELVCMDLLTSSVLSTGNAKYALIIMDAGTHFIWTYFLKSKSAEDVRVALAKWILQIKVDGLRPAAFMKIRSDNGSEFIEEQNVNLLRDNGIRHERAPPHHHVYLIERLNRTIQEMARSMLAHADLSTRFWAEAVMTSAYTLNRLPCQPYHRDKTRFEAYYGVKPDISNMRTFGCHCWVRDYDETLKIWSSRASRFRFIGYSLESPLTWKVSDVATERALNSSNVIFDEGERYIGTGLSHDTDLDSLFEDNPEVEKTIDEPTDHVLVLPTENATNKRKNQEVDESVRKSKRQTSAVRQTRSNSLPARIQGPSVESERLTCPVTDDTLNAVTDNSLPDELVDVAESLAAECPLINSGKAMSVTLSASEKLQKFQEDREQVSQAFAMLALGRKVQFAHDMHTPMTERQARSSPNAESWIQGMIEEMRSLGENDTFELIERPEGIMVLGHKWVYKMKTNESGEVTRFKCRYTALGNRQREYIDYDETFAPVVRSSSLKTLLAVAAARNLIVHQMDVDTAFLYGVMPPDPTIYMEVPEGYPIPEHLLGKENLVGRVKKGIYGLKQSPKLWNDTVNTFMISLGFTRFTADLCLYKRGSAESGLFVAIYVDDLIIAGATLPTINEFKDELKSRFKMKDLGPIHYCLGMEVHQDLIEGTITLTQNGYIESVLRRFGLLEANPKPTPMVANLILELDGTEMTFDSKSDFDYPSAIGSLLYLAGCTRPDITFAVHRLSRSLNSHRAAHHKAAIHVMRYLKGCSNIGLIYRRRDILQLFGYSDADWAAETNGRRSVTGYLFNLGDSPISWNSKMQTTVAHSSTEAEYLAMGATAKEALYLERLLSEFGVLLEVHKISTKDLEDSSGVKLKLFGDNQGALAMVTSTKLNHKTTKWYFMREHFIRDLVESGALTVGYCDTDSMPADMLTKALTLIPQRRHRDFTMTSAR